MNWESRIFDPAPAADLPAAVAALLETQRCAWPLLAAGVESLGRARSRAFTLAGARVVARHIPHRIHSTTAAVDPAAVRARPCFLCPLNLPEAEKGLAFGGGFILLANPYPIVPAHLSVVHREHIPQRISGYFRTMLELAAALPGFFILYNGAECGASAPDHLHFQAGRRDALPIWDDLARAVAGVLPGDPRHPFILAQADPASMEAAFDSLYDRLAGLGPTRPEPMLNILTVREAETWKVLVFARAKHRPTAFHTGALTWSPGSIDMGGVVVLPAAGDLEKVTVEDIERGYREVCISAAEFESVRSGGKVR